MRKGGGHAKGASFERQVCKDLSLWITSGKRDDIFWRTAMSGGRATIGARKGKDREAQAGDVMAIHPIGRKLTGDFIIECKHVRALDFGAFVVADRGALSRFLKKHQSEAETHKKSLFMVLKQNSLPTVILLNEFGVYKFMLFHKTFARIYKDFGSDQSSQLFLVLFKDFLEYAQIPKRKKLK